MNALTLTPALATLAEDTINFARADKAEKTLTVYTACWNVFTGFCATYGLAVTPPDVRTVTMFLTSLEKQGKALSTIHNHLSAIKYFLGRQGQPLNAEDPLLLSVIEGITRKLGSAQVGSDAVLPSDLRALVNTCPGTVTGLRDRAIMLLGFAGAFRRSEMTSLVVEDLTFVDEGLVILLRRSKTDQHGHGMEKAIPFAQDLTLCPVRALRTWLSAAGITEGPLFRRVRKNGLVGSDALSDESVRLIVTGAAKAAGIEGKITPHSLRAGFCTAAALNNVDLARIGKHVGHASVQTTMRYVRIAERFKDHAGAGLL